MKVRGTKISSLSVIFFHLLPYILFPESSISKDINEIFKGFFCEYIKLTPETALMLDSYEICDSSIPAYKFDDASLEIYDKDYSLYEKYRKQITDYDLSRLPEKQDIKARILLWHINDFIGGKEFKFHDYLINPEANFHTTLTQIMTEKHYINSKKDAINYIKRLKYYENKVEGILEQLRMRRESGVIPPVVFSM